MLNVDIVFSDIGMGIFQYNLTISNTGTEEIPLLLINDAPVNDPVIGTSLTTPPQFVGNYDPAFGAIDFAENTSTFMPGTSVSGFSFQSSAQPGTAFTDFTAFTNGGDSAVVTSTLVPEPTTAMLALGGILAFASRRRR